MYVSGFTDLITAETETEIRGTVKVVRKLAYTKDE